jgi:membrane protein DedA with SNARE-associated domain
MNQVRFHIYTFVGSFPWCYALAYVGWKLGATWQSDPRLKDFFHRFHLGVEAVLLAGFIWYVVSHWKNRIRTETA